MLTKNKQWRLKARPVGEPSMDTWDYTESELPTITDGQLLIKIEYISIDPAMRGWLNDAKSYIEPVQIGDVMRAGTVGKVIESKHQKFAVGDYVCGHNGVQSYAVSDGTGLHKIDPNLAPLSYYLGVLGMPGMTGYFGLLKTGEPKTGETVVVSGAAGAVGGLVGQIAKIKGCRVVGIAGGSEKCKFLVDELGFDAAVDYKNENVKKGLKKACPKGVDVFFDNVGGDILDDVLTQINLRARIVICGAISQYNNTTAVKGPSNYLSLLVNRARMEGIVVFDNIKEYPTAMKDIAAWIQSGDIKVKDHIVEGIETFPDTLLMLFKGKNFGKLVLKVEG
ncbi:NADP-dependent oxidoreductase [Psychrobacter sp.]|uniref:NADP-dependent oxidoreductase n=1 Tax=Psychrobacter sp. TaxID=56811 RepID=UPI002648A32B|nr:NADP-dependent oxidoreductase [Psychrobacter sp.]MDN6275919.1 NADP-dependent oxidoreductase [Psychrobacter sp.]MDN6308342.1 NADP-dependent oxidoreductase [Psychrobacter sp.]